MLVRTSLSLLVSLLLACGDDGSQAGATLDGLADSSGADASPMPMQPGPESGVDPGGASHGSAGEPTATGSTGDTDDFDPTGSTGSTSTDAEDTDDTETDTDDPGPGGEKGSCCTINAVPGCETPEVEACVCDFDDYCCTEIWDYVCVETARAECGHACTDEDDDRQPCCDVADSPGCEEASLEACVCAADAYCCESSWDEDCVALASLCGGECIL